MKISQGIASTTHIDRNNDQMAKSALDGMAEQINKRFIPLLFEHDSEKQMGLIIYSEVFQLDDKEYALGIVFGLFESQVEQKTYINGEKNTIWMKYKDTLNIDELKEMCSRNTENIGSSSSNQKDQNIGNLLATHLDSTGIWIDGSVYFVKHYIASTCDLKIELYPNDHDPPHFHVVSKQREINARFNIGTLECINTKHGKIKPKDIKKIQNFFKNYPDALKKLNNEYSRFSETKNG